jgi:dTDP-4-dehydrorhamnose reductase
MIGCQITENEMEVMVIGANGQLGWELNRRGLQRGHTIEALDLPDFDITDKGSVADRLNQSTASVVVNASAYTAVDHAESEAQAAFEVNRDGPADLASACARQGVPLIHISTDYVFDGSKKEPYVESDPLFPLGIYGKSKAEGEEEIRRILSDHIILRTAWLYGVHGHNFVKTMLRLGEEHEVVRVVSDQFGCPTNAADLAGTILSVIAQFKERTDIPWGTYHYCGRGTTTWHGFAEAIFSIAKKHRPLLVKKVVPIPSSEFPTQARRPANSVLNCSLVERNFGIKTRPWQESLPDMIEQLLSVS